MSPLQGGTVAKRQGVAHTLLYQRLFAQSHLRPLREAKRRDIAEVATIERSISREINHFCLAGLLRYLEGALMSDKIQRKLFTANDCYRMSEAGRLKIEWNSFAERS